jgi:RNA polymerase sigma factor (sigma-70 family)
MSRTASGQLSEPELINMFNQKNDQVFDFLYDKYWHTLLNYAGSYVTDRDACKEIVQEFFITLHKKKPQITSTSSLSSYLYSSLRNRILNYIRDESVYKKHINGATKSAHHLKPYNNVEQFINLVELKKEIFNCLNKMPVKYREVYLMYMQNQYSLTTIAELLQRPLATVEKQFRKASFRLRDYLGSQRLYS